MSEFRTPRFGFAVFFSISTTVGWWNGKMTGMEYAGAIAAILALWGGKALYDRRRYNRYYDNDRGGRYDR